MTSFYYHRHVEREILSALVDGELSPEQRRFVHEHLQECGACSEAAEEFGALQGMVGDLPRLIAPAAFVSDALVPSGPSTLARASATALAGRRRWVAGGIAAAAVAVTLAGLFTPPRASEPPVDVFVARHVSVSDGTESGGQVLFAVP